MAPAGGQASRHLPRAFGLGACVCATLLLSGCQTALMDPRGAVGIAEKTILIDSLAIMLAIVVPTILATLGVAWWFRAGNTRAKYLPDWEYSGQLEMIVWAIPLLTIILLGGVAWVGSHELDPAKPLPGEGKPLEVQVVSLDWKWLFIYPDQQIASVNALVIPAGQPVHFSLTSASVMNAFFVPRLGSMIYTMNGMTSQLNLVADEPGTYPGMSSHYSGDGFAQMHFDVRALPPDQFSEWLVSTLNKGGSLDDKAYAQLSRQSIDVAPATYGSVAPALFNRIVDQTVPPAPGPDESGGVSTSAQAEK